MTNMTIDWFEKCMKISQEHAQTKNKITWIEMYLNMAQDWLKDEVLDDSTKIKHAIEHIESALKQINK